MGELMQQYIDEAEQDLLHTYNRYQVVLDRGDGVSLYDIEGKRYLDFHGGIGAVLLGYADAEVNAAVKHRVDNGSLCVLASPAEVVHLGQQVEVRVTGIDTARGRISLSMRK